MTDKQIAIVTGASRGIGAAIANVLQEKGFFVIGSATTESGAAHISKSLGENGRGVILDVRDRSAIDHLVKSIVSEFGTVHVLVNNAGITKDGLMMRMDEQDWDDVLDTDLKSVFNMTQACMRSMIKSRYGRIVNITSVVGSSGNPGQGNYCAAKAGVVGMSKALALELGGRGITVNCVAPGFIDTDMTTKLTTEQREAILSKIPMGRMGSPVEIAHAVAFFSSEHAGYVSGVTLHVNGGMYLV
jgi:3-oxoacyl-[acyl-carrier protein] reductase